MSIVQRIGEGLARRTTRRQKLQAVFGTLFGTTAAWAVEGPLGSGALAERCVIRYSSTECSPPGGRYCNDASIGGDASYCDGAKCVGGCTYNEYWYPQPHHNSCWCTAFQTDENGRFYYKCCDCSCDLGGERTSCGCKGKVRVDWSLPDRPKPDKPDRPRRRDRRRGRR